MATHEREQGALDLGAAAGLFQGWVREGADRAGWELDEEVEAYLVFALMRHLRDAPLGGRVMALEWLAAHELAGVQRVDALRDVGDRCLILAGLFPAQAERRRVSHDYFIELGRGAYAAVAEQARSGYAELFARLVEAYRGMVAVLAAAAGRVSPAADPRRVDWLARGLQ